MGTRRAERLYAKVAANQNDCDYASVERLLQAVGFKIVGKTGSHMTFRHESGKRITIVSRNPVKVVYVKAALKLIDSLREG